ncbi:MAG TPA: YARHG domain-containing protein [Stellaceae bacterium]|nr:YARHG domain-containing protein [Stellaceae bacterium]
MRPSLAAIALCLCGATAIVSAGTAYAQSCDQFWYQRNEIYKSAGYCFKTQRAISTFGNAGCMYDVDAAVPLSPAERERIAYLVHLEQRYGCRR